MISHLVTPAQLLLVHQPDHGLSVASRLQLELEFPPALRVVDLAALLRCRNVLDVDVRPDVIVLVAPAVSRETLQAVTVILLNSFIGVPIYYYSSAPEVLESGAPLLVFPALSLEHLIHQVRMELSLHAERQRSRMLCNTHHELTQIYTNESDPERHIDLALTTLWRTVPYDSVNLSVQQEGKWQVLYHSGYAPSAVQRILNSDLSVLPTYQTIQQNQQTLYIPDVTETPLWQSWDELGTRSWVGVPILGDGRVIGILNIESRTPYHYSPQHLQLLEVFAQQLTLVIKNTQLNTSIRKTTFDLETLKHQMAFLFTPLTLGGDLEALCQQVAQTVITTFNHADCGVMLLDAPNAQLQRYARAGDYEVHASGAINLHGEGLVAQASRTGKVVYAPDVTLVQNYVANEPRTQSELVIPLRTAKNQVIGVLDLQSPTLDAFSPMDQRALMAFAEHVSFAIHNHQLYSDLARQAETLERRVIERTAQLHATTRRVEALLNYAGDVILLIDSTGEVLQANRAFYTLMAEAPINLHGLTLQSLLNPSAQSALPQLLSKAKSSYQNEVLETQLILPHRGNIPLHAEVAVRVIGRSMASTDVPDYVVSIRDISKHKTAELSLMQALDSQRELNELKTRFILTVSHEFRTPLTVILTSSGLLREYGATMAAEQQQRYFNRIEEQVRHMEQMLNDVLLIGRADSGQVVFEPTQLQLGDLVASIIHHHNDIQQTHEIHLIRPEEEPTLLADPQLISQMVNNLLNNAIKYSPQANRVDVEVGYTQSNAWLKVRDYGIGVADADRPHLFQPFYRGANTTTISGTGLGLSIVAFAAQRHGGTIDLQSTLQVGTTITVSLPFGGAN